MDVTSIQRLQPLASPGKLHAQSHAQHPDKEKGFGATLRKAVERIEASQQTAHQQAAACEAGDQESLHQAMTSLNHASVSFQLMTEFRNRALEAYQELMRMQV